MVIMDCFTSYTHLIPLKDATSSEKIFKKLNSTIFDVHGLPLSIVLDQDSHFTFQFWSQMMKYLGIQVWMATQYHHQTNGQVERRILTLKQLMRNFVNLTQNNWSGALPSIAAAMNGAPHECLGISSYHALSGWPWKIFNPVQRSARQVPAVDPIFNAQEVTRMEVAMAREHATLHQTVQADKRRKPLTEPFKNGSRVLVRVRPSTSGDCPKDPEVRKQRKKAKRKEQDWTSTSNTALEKGQALHPNIPYLSESLVPFRMNDTILATPPMGSAALIPLYIRAGYDTDEANNAKQFAWTVPSCLMGILVP